MSSPDHVLSRTRAGREEAASVLNSLIHTKATSEPILERLRSWAPAGSRPASLGVDNAIASARRLVESLDRIVTEIELDAEDIAILSELAADPQLKIAPAQTAGQLTPRAPADPIEGPAGNRIESELDRLIGDYPARRAA